MHTPDQNSGGTPGGKTKWTEGDVERLLVDFFASEVPADLRPAKPVLQPAKVNQSPAFAWGGMLAAAAALMLAVGIFRSVATDGETVADNGSQKIEQIETDNGTVEMRTQYFVEVDPDKPEFTYHGFETEFDFDADAMLDETDSDNETDSDDTPNSEDDTDSSEPEPEL